MRGPGTDHDLPVVVDRVRDTVTDLAATARRRLIREAYLDRMLRALNASHAILPLAEPGHFPPARYPAG